MSKDKILIVEDEESIRTGLIDLFTFHGFSVDFAEDGKVGLEKALQNDYQIILLDVMLPHLNGFDVCNAIRNKNLETPIIMLTAKDSEEDIIGGLSLGADDYMTKPFSIKELLLRVQSILKRTRTKAATMLKFGDHLEVNLETLQGVCSDGKTIPFSAREVDILSFLLQKKEVPTSRDELLSKVWGYENTEQMETRTVDIHMAKLRKKIEQDVKDPKFLVTVRSKGYRLENCY